MNKNGRVTYKFEVEFKKVFSWRCKLSNNDIISSRSGLKTGVENEMFWSEMGSGFKAEDGTPPPRLSRSTPSRVLYLQSYLRVFAETGSE